ncbi:MAG: AI-2E family transporter [Ktedonobacterales bacterium]|nr:AI-2E family transporter [Ktedonobacterales bacterium]
MFPTRAAFLERATLTLSLPPATWHAFTAARQQVWAAHPDPFISRSALVVTIMLTAAATSVAALMDDMMEQRTDEDRGGRHRCLLASNVRRLPTLGMRRHLRGWPASRSRRAPASLSVRGVVRRLFVTRSHPMHPATDVAPPLSPQGQSLRWGTRRDQVLVWLGYTLFLLLAFWLASHFVRALLLLGIGALLAYALYPPVRFFSRFLPRPVALLVVYLLLVGLLGALGYLVVSTSVGQVASLIIQVQRLLTPGTNGAPAPLISFLEQLGFSQDQITAARDQVVAQLEGLAKDVVPFVTGVINSVLDTLLILVLSVYLLIDGERVTTWLTTSTPKATQTRVTSFVGTLQRVVGGYIRGQLILSTLIGVLVGVGMFVLGVPDAMLLGVLAFLLAFIPLVGTLASGVACVLLALTKGWVLALIVLGYFVVVHIIESDVVGPRVVGKAVGLHPAVSIVALIAGGELFGIVGAFFASLIAGLAQALLVDGYVEWRKAQPRDFPSDNPVAVGAAAAVATATPPGSAAPLDVQPHP